MSSTPQLAEWIIDHFFRGASVTAPSGLYLALYTYRPEPDGLYGEEVTGGSYDRQEVTLGAVTDFSAANTTALDFVGMPACTVVAGGLFTAYTGGVLMQHERFTLTRAVAVGKTFTVAAGDIVVKFG